MSAIPFVPFSNVAKMEMIFLWNSQYCENVLHYQSPAALDAGKLEDAASALFTKWTTGFKSHQPAVVSLVKIKATDLTSESAPAIEFADGLPVAGTAAEGSEPNNVTAVIKFTTALRGRSYRGRYYVIGLTPGIISNSTLLAGGVTILQSWGESLMALTVTGADWPLVIASRQHNKVVRTVGVATEVTGVFVDPTLDSQRRRLPGRGR